MSRKKILWLCSWYPSRVHPFNGDFIQRHAQAAALYNDIYVIHVIGDARGMTEKKAEEINQDKGLTEQIIYFKRPKSGWGKLVAGYRWLYYSRNAIKKYISQQGKPDAVHVHVPMKMGVLGIWLKRRYGIPFNLTEHLGIYNDTEVANFNRQNKLFQNYTRKIFEQAAQFITPSKFLGEGVNRMVTKKGFIIIPNTVNQDLFHFSPGKKGPGFRFIHVSNMVALKNAEGILRAFKQFLQPNSDAELIMVGDKDNAIRQYAKQLDLDTSVQFRGEIPYPGVAEEMQSAHCLILFSNIENSPCVIGEALSCGIPVIATRVGGIPELVNEPNCILVEPGNEQALANAMQDMKENYQRFDQKKIAELAKAKFSYPVIGKMLDEIYSS